MFETSEAAEAAFYAAFARGRLDEMMRVWAPAADIVCIHPGGPRLCGVDEVRQSWRHILADSTPRAFDLRGLQVLDGGDQRIHLLEENIRVPGTTFTAPPVLATNIYRRDADGWRMVVHHASVSPAALRAFRPAPTGSAPPRRLH